MSPDPERNVILDTLSSYFTDFFGLPLDLETDTLHLRNRFLRDVETICERSKWSMSDLKMLEFVLRPLNGEYRIEVVKRLTDINVELLNPWNVEYFFRSFSDHEPLSEDDVTDEHLSWVAVAMLVSGGTYAMYEGLDLGFLREPVEAAQRFLNEHSDRRVSIKEIIRARRVYKPEDIEILLTGGEPLHKGAL